MTRTDFSILVIASLAITTFAIFGYDRVINAAYVISTPLTRSTKVAEPPLLPTTNLQVVDNHGLVQTYDPQVVGKNESNNWGE